MEKSHQHPEVRERREASKRDLETVAREHSALGLTVSVPVALGSVSSTVEWPLIVTKHSLTALVLSAIVLLARPVHPT